MIVDSTADPGAAERHARTRSAVLISFNGPPGPKSPHVERIASPGQTTMQASTENESSQESCQVKTPTSEEYISGASRQVMRAAAPSARRPANSARAELAASEAARTLPRPKAIK
jgi:hypothetical protein